MTRQSFARRLGRLEATVFNRNQLPSEALLRVAGKTKEQSEADHLEWFRQMLSPVICPADEREAFLQRIAESNLEFAGKLTSLLRAASNGRKSNVLRPAV